MPNDWLERARASWAHRGEARPAFAKTPGPGEESVWDYPRPPRLEADSRVVRVLVGERLLVETRGALRLLETASPPTFYLPRADIASGALRPAGGGSFCEWKGAASYYDVVVGDTHVPGAAWSYDKPNQTYAGLAGFIAFYPAKVSCFVDGHPVDAQAGGFYGGWVTPEIVGPFKGEPGTGGW